MPIWGHKKSEAESGRQHGAEARSIPGWLATDPFSGVAGLLNRWAAPVFWEALDEKVTPLLVEDAVESVKLRGAKLELKAAGQVGWIFLSALRMVYKKTLTQDAEIRKLRDEVAALQERHLLMKETIKSAVNRGDQMEARCTALAVRVAKQKSKQKPKVPSAVQVRALVRKEKWDPCTWDGTVSDNDDDWNWEDEVEVRVAELGGVESGEGRAEANEQLREMGMQNAVYSQKFLGPDVEPVTAGIRARLIRNAPPHMKGALLALLGPAQGGPVGDVVLLMAQLEGLDRQKSARAVGQDNKYKGRESTIKVTRRQMWIDLLNAGVKKEEIDGKPTHYLLNKWKALQRRQKEKEAVDEKQPSAPPMEESEKEKTESGKNRKVPVSTLYPDLSSDGWEVPDPLL
ncbi:hypothetical protein NDU88_008325 [Pleurodeles waltl]|uniref:Uncharacterized protein n=1 Tax=Pleurodeles waltl TaxID=8319 RepID=A0AAV7QRG1_PLEWA|nr:hypothetical protein NDU88_008325 [Pleurodeles waltl]